jgi:hypothetical protein
LAERASNSPAKGDVIAKPIAIAANLIAIFFINFSEFFSKLKELN